MIALVRLLPPVTENVGTVALDALPRPPASAYSGFAVRCDGEPDVVHAIEWYRQVLEQRPAVPLGVVCRPDHCAGALARLGHSLTFLISPRDLVAGGLPATLLDEVRSASVEGRLLEEVLARHGDSARPLATTIRALISRAVRGGSLAGAARDLDVAERTVRRRLKSIGLSPGILKRELRLRAFELRVKLGMSRSAALAAGGWANQAQRRKCKSRLHRSGLC